MTEELERAREDVRQAAEVAEEDAVSEQLRSVDEGLEEMTRSSNDEMDDDGGTGGEGEVSTEGDHPHGEKLQQVEAKLAGLGDEAGDRAAPLIRDARDEIDEYRQRYTRDW